MRVHASTVAIGGRGVMLFGPSGAGKSDLALRLIDEGAILVSDDYTEIDVREGTLIARAPDTIRGKIEVRGIGIVELATLDDAPVSLAVDVGAVPERFPERAVRTFLDIRVPLVAINARAPAASAKVRLALANLELVTP